MATDTQRIVQLEQQLQQLIKQNSDLSKHVVLLQRENNRRRSEIQQLASAVNRQG